MVIQSCVTIPWTSPGKVESNVQGPLFVSSGVTEKSRIVSTPCILNTFNLPYVVVATVIRPACSLLRQGLTMPLGLAWNLLSKPGCSGISWVLGLKICSTMPYLSKLGFLYVWIFFAYMYTSGAVRSQKRLSDPRKLVLQMGVSHFFHICSISVETGNQT